MRSRAKLLAGLVFATIMLALPATADADALVLNQVQCAFSPPGKTYVGSGTEVITPSGKVLLTCHEVLVSGAAVERPTTTTIGNCEILETPGGVANVTCHFEL